MLWGLLTWLLWWLRLLWLRWLSWSSCCRGCCVLSWWLCLESVRVDRSALHYGSATIVYGAGAAAAVAAVVVVVVVAVVVRVVAVM